MIEKNLEIIICAAKQVTKDYLKLTTTYEPSGIVRERVFCYELYHQLRLILRDNNTLTLNGEIDKRGHRDFRVEDQKNPDFVFHIPGKHKGNLDSNGIIKDFETITTFISKYQYKAGIFLLYNHTLEELLERLGDRLDKFIYSQYSEQIFIATLPKAHQIESRISLKELEIQSKQKAYGTTK